MLQFAKFGEPHVDFCNTLTSGKMKTKQIFFFATANDIKSILIDLESHFTVKYYKLGILETKEREYFDSISDMPNFGYSQTGDWNSDFRFLIMPKEDDLKIEEIQLRKGGVKYTIDESLNINSLTFQLGGIYKDTVLLAGKLGYTKDVDFSNDFYKLFTTRIKKEFSHIGSFFVGEDAKNKLIAGWRLVTNVNAAKEYDLVLQ